MNKSHFHVQPGDYSRNQILSSFMEDAGASRTKILPCMKKSAFKRVIWLNRRHLVNDFFISDYDTFVIDRASVAKNSLKARKLWFRDWLNFRFSRYLLADTATHLNYWESLFGPTRADTLVVPVLANRNIYRPATRTLSDTRPLVLFYGTYIPLQGLDVIVNAVHSLPQWWGRARFRFIGHGQVFPSFYARVKQLGLEPHVEIVGNLIPEPELAAEIQQSDLVLGIFGSSVKARAVVPNKVYQALSCGKCVITSDTPAIREFFTSDDMCLIDGTPEGLARAIDALLLDSERRIDIAASGAAAFDRLYRSTHDSFVAFIRKIERSQTVRA